MYWALLMLLTCTTAEIPNKENLFSLRISTIPETSINFHELSVKIVQYEVVRRWKNIEKNYIKVQLFLSSMFLNHSLWLTDFFHRITYNSLTKCWFMFSKIDLLTFPSSFLVGFIRWQCKLD